MKIEVIVCIALLGLASGCPPDGGGTDTATTSTESSTSSTSTGLASETDQDPTTGAAQCADFEGLQEASELAVETHLVEVGKSCPLFSLPAAQFDNSTTLSVAVYRPNIGNGAWPATPLPTILFVPGVGQNIQTRIQGQLQELTVDLYDHIFRPLVADGFIVVAVEIDDAASVLVEFRRRAVACTLTWLETQWKEVDNDRRNCDVTVMGHSRGGEAIYNIVDTLTELGVMHDFGSSRLKAAVAIAPFSEEADGIFGSAPISADEAVPFLVLAGGNDEDTSPGDAVRLYDLMSPEETGPPLTDKVLMWAHDVAHNAWGGVLKDSVVEATADEVDKARAIAGTYTRLFLRWQVLTASPEDEEGRACFSNLVTPRFGLADDSLFPTNVREPNALDPPSYWDNLEPQWSELMSPLLFADLALGVSGPQWSPIAVDTMQRPPPPATGQCAALTPASGGATVSTVDLGEEQVCLGAAAELSSSGAEHHHTSVMRVAWGGGQPEARVRWEFEEPLDLTDFTHVSLRVGPSINLSPTTAVALQLSLGGFDDQGQPVDAPVSLGLLVAQDESPPMKFSTDLMRTIRLKLAAFGAQGLDLAAVERVDLILPVSPEPRGILVDSLEVTREPVNASACPEVIEPLG